MGTAIKSIVPYWGSKNSMVPHILPLIPEHRSYVEPFCGGAAVFWNKKLARRNVLNDLNKELTNFYMCAKLYPDELLKYIDAIPCSQEFFIHYRRAYDNFTDIEKAAAWWAAGSMSKFYVRNAFNFARDSGSGGHNSIAKTLHNKQKLLSGCIDMLRVTEITQFDFEKCINIIDKDDVFFFIDPPYVSTNASDDYNAFTHDDLTRLLETLKNIKGKFMLCGFWNEQLEAFAKGYSVREFKKISDAKTNNAGTRVDKTEVLIMNYEPAQAALF